MIFVFEGLPGSGKTTISKILEKEEGFFRVGEMLDDEGKELCPSDVGGFSQTFFLKSDKIKLDCAMNYKNNNIIIDRSPLSTIAYNLCLNKKFEETKLMENLKLLLKKYSDNSMYFYIKISPKLSIQRKKKKPNAKDLWSLNKHLVKTEKIYDKYLIDKKNVLIINGKEKISEVYNRIKSEILKQNI